MAIRFDDDARDPAQTLMIERYKVVKQILAEALDLDAEARGEFIEQRCEGDAELIDEVLDLLRCADDSSDFLQGDPTRRESRQLPDRIADFRIVRKLGEGGMGVVFEAEQEQPRRRVAIKLMHVGFASTSSVQRFELEANALARLEDPGVARIYAAGTENWGAGPQPYLVMELVEGRSLTDHVDAEALSLPERVRLLAAICDAVEHAHRKGVVHRDLKPQNILVDASGRPKVLDFGIARILDDDNATPDLTAVGQIVGTLAYMSPEQAGGDPGDVDTRSDVYALGVVAYQVVTGELPLQVQGKTALEAARIVRETAPTDPRRIARTTPPDLAAILLKAIEKEPNDRYPGAFALAEDLRAFAEHRPVRARPISGLTRFSRWIRREPWKAALGAALLLACFGLTALAAYIVASAPIVAAGEAQLVRERVALHLRRGFSLQQSGQLSAAAAEFDAGLEHDPHNTELMIGRALSTPIEEARAWLDAQHVPGTEPQALDRVRAYLFEQTGNTAASKKIESGLKSAKTALDLIVAGWIELSRVPRMPQAMRKAVTLFSRAQLRSRVPSFITLSVLAEVGASIGDFDRARDASEALMELWPDEAYGPSAAAHLLAREQRNDEAIELLRAALARKPRGAIILRYRLAAILAHVGRDDESYEILTKLCEEDPNNARALTKLSPLLARRGELDAAIQACEKALAIGDYEPFETRANLGYAYMVSNELEAAEEQFRRVHRVVPDHENAHNGLLRVYAARSDAEAMVREIERWIAVRPDDHNRHVQLARYYLESEQIGVAPDPAKAVAAARVAVEKSRGADAIALWTQARAHVMLGQAAPARALVERAMTLVRSAPRPEPGLESTLRALMRGIRRMTRDAK